MIKNIKKWFLVHCSLLFAVGFCFGTEQPRPRTELKRLQDLVTILKYSDQVQKAIIDSAVKILVEDGTKKDQKSDPKDFIKDQLSNIDWQLNHKNFKTLFKPHFNWICVCIFVHSLVEAVCELLCRMKKTENKQKLDMERFGKDLVERIVCCGKDGFVSRASLIKVPIKILLAGFILSFLNNGLEASSGNSSFGDCAMVSCLLCAFFAFITFCLELLCEVKDRILRKPSNSNGFRGFCADLGKRFVKGKKEDSVNNWAAVKFTLKVAIIAFCVAIDDLNSYREYRYKWLPLWNELKNVLLSPLPRPKA